MLSPLSLSRKSLIRSLHRKKGRVEEGAFLAEGERLLSELAKNPHGVRFLFGVRERAELLADQFPGIPCFTIDGDGAGLFATEQSQGVGAVVDIPPTATLDALAAGGAPIIYLDRIADPGNAGTIVRTAEWFGIDRVIFGEGTVDPYNPKGVRATMGALFHMQIVADVTPAALVALGLPIIALDAGGRENLDEATLPRHAIYVVGSEAHGLSPEIRSAARLLAIAGRGTVESLNAAIAAGILLYQLSRFGVITPPTASQPDRP